MLLRCIMMLCIVMQVGGMLPHHHHTDSDTACFNLLHCVSAHEHALSAHDDGHENGEVYCAETCGDIIAFTYENGLCGTDGDKHTHDGNDSRCAVNHIDVVVPVRENESTDVTVTDVSLLPVIVFNSTDAAGFAGLNKEYYIPDIYSREQIPVSCCDIDYIVRAIPPRAPSFTV